MGGLFLGIRILSFGRTRLLAAFAGIAVAVVVMFVELGLLLGVLNSQALMADLVRGDLVVVSQARTNLHKWNELERVRLYQIAGIAGVKSVAEFYQGTMGLKVQPDNAVRRIMAIAFAPDASPLAIGDPSQIRRALSLPRAVLYDRLSRGIFGSLHDGDDIELDGVSYRVQGFVDIGPDIVNDGAIVMSAGSWLERHPSSRPIMGVITLQEGVDVNGAKERIRRAVPDDVAVFTPAEIRAREIAFTLKSAPIGILFGIGLLAGLVIGSITCYQILFNEILDRLDQYAMLKAMGFSDGFLRRVILEQAILLSAGGFVVGLAASAFFDSRMAEATGLAVRLSPASASLVFALTIAMSLGAGLLALRKVHVTDPAELY